MRSLTAGRTSAGLSTRSLRHDVPAGVVLGVESVPDGLAGGLLAGINPVYGLYGYLFGTLFGAMATSSAFMAVQATGAMAVVVSDIEAVQGDSPEAATTIVTLAVLTGVVMLVLGLARLGWIVRWVPNAVLTGFINAVAVNIVLGQLDNFTGYAAQGANRVAKAFDTLTRVGLFVWPAVLVGGLTILLIVLLERTRLGALGMVVAIVVTSGLVELLDVDDVVVLNDITTIPASLPTPTLPDLTLVLSLAIPALSLAFVGLVQGAAISSSVPNPDGTYPDPSGDFRGQGVANISSGLFSGMPVGGSMSATSIVTTAGARSRTALFVAAATMAVSVLLFADMVGSIAMPALAGLLMVVGVKTFKPDNVRMVLRTGGVQATVMLVTFVLTMIIPLQYAVLIGVGLSIILYVARQSNRVRLVRWTFSPDGTVTEDDPPAELRANEVVVRPYGSLFFAAAGAVEQALPKVGDGCTNSVVIVSLRGKEDLGSTFVTVMTRYASRLRDARCTVMLAGVSDGVARQLEKTGAESVLGRDNVFPATAALTQSTRQAMDAAQRIVARPDGPAAGTGEAVDR